jgi:hypothetical protein
MQRVWKYWMLMPLLLVLAACASTLDAAATAQNASNVKQIAAENADFSAKLASKATTKEEAALLGVDPISLQASAQRNAAAVQLAEAMAKDVGR